MNTKKFSEAMNQLDDKYVDEALRHKAGKPQAKMVWVKWCAAAACICLILAGAFILTRKGEGAAPKPQMVQVPNPIITVTSAAEMDKYLDFKVPVLNKDVKTYAVFVLNRYPTIGQITYTDGSEFRVQYGSGDISGIHGGTKQDSKTVDGVKVSYFKYEDKTYAIWEEKGFTFSYLYTGKDAAAEIETLIRQF